MPSLNMRRRKALESSTALEEATPDVAVRAFLHRYHAAMGRLRELASGREVLLLASHFIGRDGHCDLVVNDPRVSMAHAALRWDGAGWSIRDMGSTNRTFVNSKVIDQGTATSLRAGDLIDIGTAAVWKLIDEGPPSPIATRLDTGERLVSADEHVLAITSQLVLYRGEGGRVWHTHDGRLKDDFVDDDTIEADGVSYKLSLPAIACATTPAGGFVGRRISEVRVSLKVTPGEDRIECSLSCDGVEVSLGRHGHNRVLLLLAQARMHDQSEQLPASLAGWRDVQAISHRSYRDLPRLNTEVYRIRKKLAPLHLLNFADIIERDEEQIRLGTALVSVTEN